MFKNIKRIFSFILALSMITSGSNVFADVQSTVDNYGNDTVIYVAPDGDDNGEGTINNPLATLKGARNKVRELKTETEGVTVYFRGGFYNWTETVYFYSNDSGYENAEIVYAAYPGETPVFTGGYRVSGGEFGVWSENSNVLTFDLKAFMESKGYTDVYDYYDLKYDSYGNGMTTYKSQGVEFGEADIYASLRRPIFSVGDAPALWLARYPNKTEAKYEQNPHSAYLKSGTTQNLEDGRKKFSYTDERIKNYVGLSDVRVQGYFEHYFWHEDEKVVINEDGTIETVASRSGKEYNEGRDYFLYNILSELDQAGEYYIDKEKGILYVYPNADLKNSYMNIPCFDRDYMVRFSTASHITFDGITFENTKGSAIYVTGGEYVGQKNCKFYNMGVSAVKIGNTRTVEYTPFWDYLWTDKFGTDENDENGNEILMDPADAAQKMYDLYTTQNRYQAATIGKNHGLDYCVIKNTGEAAVDIMGGNFYTQEKAENYVTNSTMTFSGVNSRTYSATIRINCGAYGITIANNKIAHIPSTAITGYATGVTIENNEIYDALSESYDMGVIYLNYIVPVFEVVIRNNYIHHIPMEVTIESGIGSQRSGIAFDNSYGSAAIIENNILEEVPRGMFLHASETVRGNTFINCYDPIYTGTMGTEYAADKSNYYIKKEGTQLFDEVNREQLHGLTYMQVWPIYAKESGAEVRALWQEKYPGVLKWVEVIEEGSHEGNFFANIVDNTFINDTIPLWRGHVDLNTVVFADVEGFNALEDNVYSNTLLSVEEPTDTEYTIKDINANRYTILVEFNETMQDKAYIKLCDENGRQISTYSEIDKNKLEITVDEALDITKIYMLELTVGNSKIKKALSFDVLFLQDFSNAESAKGMLNGYNSYWTVEDEMIKRYHWSFYPTFATITTQNINWEDYTVEFDYLGSKNPSDNPNNVKLKTFMNVTNPVNSMDSHDIGANAAVSIDFWSENYLKIWYSNPSAPDERATEVNSELDGKTMTLAEITSSDCTVSASLFNNDVYGIITASDGTIARKGSYTIPDKLVNERGAFAVTTGFDNDTADAYSDNYLAYTLNYSDMDYADNEEISVYGTKEQIVVEFEKDVIDADAKISTALGESISSTSDYSSSTLLVSLDEELSLDGVYKMQITYGVADKKYIIEVAFGYNTLFRDDFSNKAVSANNYHTGQWNGAAIWTISDNATLIKNKSLLTYAQLIKASGVSEWSDYTVEFDFLAKDKQKFADGSDLQHHEMNVFFYVDENLGGNNRFLIDTNSKTYFANQVRSLKSGTFTNANLRYSASLFGGDAYASVKNLETNKPVLDYVVSNVGGSNGKASGTFAISAFCNWNDPTENTFDNILCYKLYVIEDTKIIADPDCTITQTSISQKIGVINAGDKQTMPLLAAYDKDDKLLGAAVGTNESFELKISNINTGDVEKIKLMLWDKSNGMKPLTDVVNIK